MAEPEPEPETNPEPEDSGWSNGVGGDEQIGLLDSNRTPYAEPEYDFAGTLGIWWNLHCYGLGTVFLLIGVFAIRSTTILSCRKHGKTSTTKPFLMFINLLVVTMCLLRAVYLFVNPYDQRGFFSKVVNNILFNIPFPCITTCFAMILWVFREVGQAKLSVQSRSRSLRALLVITVTHLGLVIVVIAIIEFTRNEILLIVLCHGFFVLWELFLCFSAVLLMYRISKAIKETGKTLSSISTRGRSSALQDTNNVKMNINMNKASTADEGFQIEGETSTPLVKNSDKINLTKTPISETQNIDVKYDDLGEVDVEIVKTHSERQLTELDPALLDAQASVGQINKGDEFSSDESYGSSGFHDAGSNMITDTLTASAPDPNMQAKMIRSIQNIPSFDKFPSRTRDNKMALNDANEISIVLSVSSGDLENDYKISQNIHLQDQDSKFKENDIQQESSGKFPLEQKENEAKPTVPTSYKKQKRPCRPTSTPPVRSSIADVSRRARLTAKVTRITVATTVTSFVECILNLFFVLSLFPNMNALQKSVYWTFLFWTCLRVTEIAMACVILYFVAQPMPKSNSQSRSFTK